MFNKNLCVLVLSILYFAGSVSVAHSEDAKTRLTKQAEQALTRVGIDTLEPNEIHMIEYRRRLMGQPGLQMYVVFFNDFGQPVEYFVTNGKCTSSRKELLKRWKFVYGQVGENGDGGVYGDFIMPSATLDGTHGNSDGYVYCKTSDGKYKQWNGPYYMSDSPIELTIKPIVIEASSKRQSQN